jgi:predicted GTPase
MNEPITLNDISDAITSQIRMVEYLRDSQTRQHYILENLVNAIIEASSPTTPIPHTAKFQRALSDAQEAVQDWYA